MSDWGVILDIESVTGNFNDNNANNEVHIMSRQYAGDVKSTNYKFHGQTIAGLVDSANLISKDLLDGRIIVGGNDNKASKVILSGDATINNTGALTIGNKVINLAKLYSPGNANKNKILQVNNSGVFELVNGNFLKRADIIDDTNVNIMIGEDALSSIGTGKYSIAIGEHALKNTKDSNYNTAVGYDAMRENIAGEHSSAFGYLALANSKARYNSAFGSNALEKATSGWRNSGFGYRSLANTTTGQMLCAFGAHALDFNTTGQQNSAFGYRALYRNKTGNYNCAFGAYALQNNTTGDNDIAIGHQSLNNNTTGESCIAIGDSAGYTNTTGKYNIYIGDSAGFSNTTADNCIAIGFRTSYKNNGGQSNLGIGNYALYNAINASHNVAIGDSVMNNLTTGEDNTGIGYQSMHKITTGDECVAIGSQSLYNNKTGNYNVANGPKALYNLTAGDYNIGIGSEALNALVTGSNCIGIGDHALENATKDNNIAIGSASGANITTATNTLSIGNNISAENTNGSINIKNKFVYKGTNKELIIGEAGDEVDVKGTKFLGNTYTTIANRDGDKANMVDDQIVCVDGDGLYKYNKTGDSFSKVLTSDTAGQHVGLAFSSVQSRGTNATYMYVGEIDGMFSNNNETRGTIATFNITGRGDWDAKEKIQGEYKLIIKRKGTSAEVFAQLIELQETFGDDRMRIEDCYVHENNSKVRIYLKFTENEDVSSYLINPVMPDKVTFTKSGSYSNDDPRTNAVNNGWSKITAEKCQQNTGSYVIGKGSSNPATFIKVGSVRNFFYDDNSESRPDNNIMEFKIIGRNDWISSRPEQDEYRLIIRERGKDYYRTGWNVSVDFKAIKIRDYADYIKKVHLVYDRANSKALDIYVEFNRNTNWGRYTIQPTFKNRLTDFDYENQVYGSIPSNTSVVTGDVYQSGLVGGLRMNTTITQADAIVVNDSFGIVNTPVKTFTGPNMVTGIMRVLFHEIEGAEYYTQITTGEARNIVPYSYVTQTPSHKEVRIHAFGTNNAYTNDMHFNLLIFSKK